MTEPGEEIREAMLEGIVNRVMASLNVIPEELDELLRVDGSCVLMVDYLAKNPGMGLRVEMSVHRGYVELTFAAYQYVVYRLILRRASAMAGDSANT